MWSRMLLGSCNVTVVFFLQRMWHAAWTVHSRWAAVPSPVLKTQRVTQMACMTSASPFSTVLLNSTLRYVFVYNSWQSTIAIYQFIDGNTISYWRQRRLFTDRKNLRSTRIGWILSNECCWIPQRWDCTLKGLMGAIIFKSSYYRVIYNGILNWLVLYRICHTKCCLSLSPTSSTSEKNYLFENRFYLLLPNVPLN